MVFIPAAPKQELPRFDMADNKVYTLMDFDKMRDRGGEISLLACPYTVPTVLGKTTGHQTQHGKGFKRKSVCGIRTVSYRN